MLSPGVFHRSSGIVDGMFGKIPIIPIYAFLDTSNRYT